jgi:hypothetical protein
MKKISLLALFILLNTSQVVIAKDILSTYFDKNQIDNIKKYQREFLNIKSSNDLVNIYRKSKDLTQMLNDTLNKSKDIESGNFDITKVKKIGDSTPGLIVGYGAEGIGINVTTDHKTFLKRANLTPEKSDNNYFNLMIEIFGDSGDIYPNWFIRTWDYGGYTLLGKGTHIKMLEKINNVLKTSPEFNNEIKEIKTKLVNDILQSINFGVTKKDVVNEINKFISNNTINEQERIELHKKIRDIEINPKKYQFNCEKQNCTYG